MHSPNPPLRLIAALLALCLLFTACSPSTGEQTRVAATAAKPTATRTPSPKPTRTPTAIPTSDLGVDPADLDGLEISLWHPWSGDLEKALDALVKISTPPTNGASMSRPSPKPATMGWQLPSNPVMTCRRL